jgi:hypothetical protein
MTVLRKKPAAIALVLLAAASAAMAQQTDAPAAAEEKIEEVKVPGMRDPDFKTYRQFVLGLDAFDKHRARAPDAPLVFTLRPADGKAGFDGVTMRIAGNEESIPVPVAADGTFVMPRHQGMAEQDAEILLNRKKGQFRWRALVRTPGLPPNTRRLGDLRLECQVRWAVERSELPFLKRSVLSAIGDPCKSKMVSVHQVPPPHMVTAWIERDGKRVALPNKLDDSKAPAYVAPINVPELSDDTLIEFEIAAQSKT